MNIIVSLCITFSFYGCANLNNATLISEIQYRNKELRKEDAPIRLKYKVYYPRKTKQQFEVSYFKYDKIRT